MHGKVPKQCFNNFSKCFFRQIDVAYFTFQNIGDLEICVNKLNILNLRFE